jgi:hypothetical protein
VTANIATVKNTKMKQYRVTAEMFNPQGNNPSVPDAYVDPATLSEYGVYHKPTHFESPTQAVKNYPNLGKTQKEQNIKPGTEEWFKLWFDKK